ncbi:hypothetical protein [Rhizohabitans arisaemae]|uniref:hypothetical protein n=1 Tax=Rhizohabitans arisaemae TaxID=2720610 RepID=UPI0024B14364|nr:hypothetical protein [Rhizohabitans arisaemae]
MSVKKKVIAVSAAAAALFAATPAAADTVDTTVITFLVVSTGGINISAPESGSLFTTVPGGQTLGHVGNVTVVDQRSAPSATWTATVALTDPFHTGTGASPYTIPAGNVVYHPGAAIGPVNGPFTPGSTGTLAGPRTAYSKAGGVGNNSVAWNPRFTVQVPNDAPFGLYSGTVTHSVA